MTTRRTRLITALAMGALLLSAVARAQDGEGAEATSLEARQALRRTAQPLFDEAAREFGVPADVLRAYAFVHTRWSITQRAEREPGHMPVIFGIMGLHDGSDGWFRDQAGRAAERLGVTEDEVKEDTATNIRAAAALLRAEADVLGIRGDAVEAWAPAVERMTAIPSGDAVDRFARKSEVYDVLATLARGYAKDGIRIPARPVRLDRAFSPADLKVLRAPLVDAQALESAPAPSATSAAAPPDDPSALWNPTTCFSSRSGTKVTHVTIHMMQGYYGGTISWFKNCGNGVSAHYLVRSSDGQITQMVRESDMAWHVRASNPYTIGLEHEGWVHESSWYTTAMYIASSALTRRVCERYGIDRTKTYGGTFQGPLSDLDYTVKGHVHFANQTHTDPGVLWDWPRYRQLVIGGPERSSDVIEGESSVATALRPGETRAVTVRVKNTGTRTWTAGEAFRLGASSDNSLAWSNFRCGGYMNGVADGRAYLCQSVPSNTSHDFSFDVTAPASGPARLSLRMVQDGVAWFGESAAWSVAIGEPRAAEVVEAESQVAASLAPGERRSTVVRVRNTGTTTWTAGDAFRLGTAPGNTVAWSAFSCGGYMNASTDGRAYLCQSVPPGAAHDFRLDIAAPASGPAVLAVRMVQDGVAWFGESQSWTIANACAQGVAADRWKGEYWANATLAGAPVLTRDDGASSLAFDWGSGSPNAGCGVPVDGFSARWTRSVTLPAGTYRFTARSDDGVRVWIDGTLRLDKWLLQAPTTYTFDASLAAGAHAIRMDFYENQGGAVAELSWQAISNPCSAAVAAERWKGEYWSNPGLSGAPAMVRDDGAGFLDFDWGTGSPGASCGLPADGFSTRFSRSVTFEQGTHRFTVTGDDGVRLYVDGALKLDRWFDQAPTTYTADVALTAGAHTVRLDYYENGVGAVARLSWARISGSKLSVHTGFTGPLSIPFLRDAKPGVVKILDNFGPAAQIKAVSPATIVIGRIYEPSQPVDGDPGQRAQEWWTRNRDRILGSPAVDYWEGYNEIGVATHEQMSWYARFEAARVNILAQNGRRACIGNFSTGWPDINDPAAWPLFYPAIDAARAHAGILGLHEYGTPMQQYFESATGEGWLCARYRKAYRIHLVPDGKVLPLAITETGVDGVAPVGWKNRYTGDQYMDQLRWYDSVLRQDAYVLGATIFSLEIPGWEAFDVSPIIGPLTAHVRDTR